MKCQSIALCNFPASVSSPGTSAALAFCRSKHHIQPSHFHKVHKVHFHLLLVLILTPMPAFPSPPQPLYSAPPESPQSSSHHVALPRLPRRGQPPPPSMRAARNHRLCHVTTSPLDQEQQQPHGTCLLDLVPPLLFPSPCLSIEQTDGN